MSATVEIVETNGPLASAVNTANPVNLNFGSADVTGLVPATYPVTAAANGASYEKWIRLYVASLGTSSNIDNLKIWISDLGGGYVVGEGINTNAVTSGYSAVSYPSGGPIETRSTVAINVIPTSQPAGSNVGIAGALAGAITAAPAYSDWIVLQDICTASTPAGPANQKTITIQWDEQ